MASATHSTLNTMEPATHSTLSTMAPATRRVLSKFEWHLADPKDGADAKHLQPIFEALKDAVAKIDEAHVLSSGDADEVRDAAIATRKPMPMTRAFDYHNEGVPNKKHSMVMDRILDAEQELANSMLAAINNDTTINFLRQLGFATDNLNQTFRREALKRCALRQALTENTDATFRGLGYLKVRSSAVDQDWDLMHWEQGLGDAEISMLQTEAKVGNIHDERAFAFLDELFSLRYTFNRFEMWRIARWCRISPHHITAWFLNRAKRQPLPVLFEDLPHKGFENLHAFEYRIRNSLRVNITPKHAEPDWWPFQRAQPAKNNRGA